MYLSLYRTNMLQNPLFLEGLQHTIGIGVNVSLQLSLSDCLQRLVMDVFAVCTVW